VTADLDTAIGSIIGVENAEVAIAESSVLTLDETESTFDIKEFIALRDSKR